MVTLELLESRKYPSGDISLRYVPRANEVQEKMT